LSAPDHPLLAASLTESLRRLIRNHLSSAPAGRAVLEPLAGRVIALRLEPFGKVLYLCPTEADIQMLTEISGVPDVTIAGNLAAFTRAGLGSGHQESLKAANLDVIGDAETARRFQALSQALNIDWQRFLSRYLGFTLTNTVLSVARAGSAWTRDSLNALQEDVSEYLREEKRWLPDRSETDAFCEAVDTLRADADRLQARISRLQARLETSRQALPIQ
jgi:ubiquinone biosynthesis protein UbiJ